jgi:TMEM175 potassium channel family protein
MSEPTSGKSQITLDLERLVFFSDAVMAIAITLLAIDIRLPEAAHESAGNLAPWIAALWPKIIGFLVSFWVIALYWLAHSRCFRYIRGYDRRLVYLNFLFLMFVAFLPFPTSVLFNFSPQTVSVVLYAGTAAGMGLSLFWLWSYAVGHGFVTQTASPEVIRDVRLNLLLSPLVFIVSAVIALFNANLGMYMWFLLIPVYIFRRVTESVLQRHEAH